MIISNKKVFHTQKSTLFVFSIYKKTKKKKKKVPSSSSSACSPETACTSATSRGRPPSFYNRLEIACRRASFVVVGTFLFLGWSLSLEDTKRALPKRATTIAIKIGLRRFI